MADASVGLTAAAGTFTGRSAARDDRVLPETRWIAALIVPFLLAAFGILYLRPDDTARLFAWPVRPHMTALLMGAGYLAGAYFFTRVALATRWHEVAVGFLAVTAFTWFIGAATLLHWDRFTYGHVSFVTWVVLYVVTPFLVPALWWRNHAHDPMHRAEHTILGGVVLRVPMPVRVAMVLVGSAELVIAALAFVQPDLAIAVWPWTLTTLSARLNAGWFALPGVLALCALFETRWSAWKITLESQTIGVALILLGVVRAWSDFDPANPLRWVFAGGIALLLLGLLALHLAMRLAVQNAAGAPDRVYGPDVLST
jgi:hypothetical protein